MIHSNTKSMNLFAKTQEDFPPIYFNLTVPAGAKMKLCLGWNFSLLELCFDWNYALGWNYAPTRTMPWLEPCPSWNCGLVGTLPP